MISVMFYKVTLSLYNFTVLDLSGLRGFRYMWDESVTTRGADAIASNLLQYLEDERGRQEAQLLLRFLNWAT